MYGVCEIKFQKTKTHYHCANRDGRLIDNSAIAIRSEELLNMASDGQSLKKYRTKHFEKNSVAFYLLLLL